MLMVGKTSPFQLGFAPLRVAASITKLNAVCICLRACGYLAAVLKIVGTLLLQSEPFVLLDLIKKEEKKAKALRIRSGNSWALCALGCRFLAASCAEEANGKLSHTGSRQLRIHALYWIAPPNIEWCCVAA